KAVLRTKECRDLEPVGAEDVDVPAPLPVDAALIRQESEAAPLHQVHRVGEEHLDPGADLCRRGCRQGETYQPRDLMRAHTLLFPIAVTVAAVWAGCTPHPAPAPPPSPVAAAPAPKDPTDSLIAAMSIHDKVGQLIVPWLPGSYAALDDSSFLVATRWVDSIRVGGIIISVGSPVDVAAKLNVLQRRAGVPLVIGAGLEYGAGMRLVGGTSFPAIMAAGATGNPADAYAIGRAAALEGRAVGIHIDFAPDADLNNNPLNPIINTRSFGEDPAQVSRLVAAFVHGVQDNGMLATLKHFPGHGNTGTDSHIGLPFIGAGYAQLDSAELIP